MANGCANPQPGNVQYNYAQLEYIWTQAQGNPQAAAMAAAIAMAESGGNSTATDCDSNGSIDRGLWQINSVHGSQSTYDVMGNARAAVSISNNGTNWSPWTTYTSGAYRQFLNGNVSPSATPINATNASANNASFETDCTWYDPLSWPNCVGNAATGIIKSLIGTILNPLIQIVAGVGGVTLGGAMVIFGVWQLAKQTETYQSAERGAGAITAGVGAATGQPELLAAGGAVGGRATRAAAGQRIQTIRGRQVGARQQASAERMAGRQTQQQQAAMQREQFRQQEMSRRQRLREEARGYQNRAGGPRAA